MLKYIVRNSFLNCFLFVIVSGMVAAQPRMNAEEYIRRYKDAAVADMKKTGVPASITLSQGMYESDFGNSPLTKNANNHFGIKCHKEWAGPTFHQDDDAVDECFRKYQNAQESYDDHSNFLRSRERYQFLFALEVTDYKAWAHGLKKAGYATNPQYASKLIELIERYNLNEIDKSAGKIEAPSIASATSEVPREVIAPAKKEKEIVPVRPSGPALTSESTINNVPFVRVKRGDSWLGIANSNNLELWQVLEFNEADKNQIIHENDVVFLKPKKNKSQSETVHIVQKGETMYKISQWYGVKMHKLCQRNHLKPGEEPALGTKLYLKINKSFYE